MIESVLSRKEAIVIKSLIIPAQSPVYLRADGTIEEIIATTGLKIKEEKSPQGSWIFFDEEGNVKKK